AKEIEMKQPETLDFIFNRIVEASPATDSFIQNPPQHLVLPNGFRALKIDDYSYRGEFYSYEAGRYFKESGTGEDTYFFDSDAVWGAQPILFHTFAGKGLMARQGRRVMKLDFTDAGQGIVYKDHFDDQHYTLEGRISHDFWNDLDI
ncbi:MAG: hypothetical protein AAF549_04285, partial [Pseudomonadota bacterium]